VKKTTLSKAKNKSQKAESNSKQQCQYPPFFSRDFPVSKEHKKKNITRKWSLKSGTKGNRTPKFKPKIQPTPAKR
jgi:hypothetical protein